MFSGKEPGYNLYSAKEIGSSSFFTLRVAQETTGICKSY
jgi:hypothetical protein